MATSASEADLAAYYHACAVYCLPSLAPSEAFGLVQVEAMACAKPIVNCDLGNAVNFVAPHDVCAWTVAPNDAPALADALRHLLADAPLRDRLFSMQAMVDGTLALYRDVLA